MSRIVISSGERAALKETLRREERVWARRRLEAVYRILVGHSVEDIAGNQSHAYSIRRWIAIAERSGWRALTLFFSDKDWKPGRKRAPMPETEASRLRTEIQRLLQTIQGPIENRRLTVVDRILAGEDLVAVAQDVAVCPQTVRLWMRTLRLGGADALVAFQRTPREPLLIADAAGLRVLASRPENHRISRVIEALALLAEGRSSHDAGTRIGLAPVTVRRWLKIFRDSGFEGLRADRKREAGFANASKLTTDQKQELAELIKAEPHMSRTTLWSTVRRRYGVAYSLSGLLRLAREDLGYQSAARQ
ncbi:MAG TPA: helix-turn-helix domain-containing protein [Stellaceae bacterium]|jgi:transposase|nr:helix-turn-helix domain-containing protein [Stellaceae bacterium]